MQHWQLQEAKARMSELVKRAQEAPQGSTLHGMPVAVLVLRRSAGLPVPVFSPWGEGP